MKKYLITCLSISFLTLNSCASIVNGQNQSVSVNTPTKTGATCSLENDKGKWFVPQTPGSVTVHRSYKDLVVNCKKQNYAGEKKVVSKTKGMAFGNILFGGVIGAGVDMADGSAYDYPNQINVPLQKA